MTLALYARRKGWPLEGVTIELQHSRIYAADCADCEIKDGRLDRIETSIALAGRLADEQRARLLEIARKCPVHRTLTSLTPGTARTRSSTSRGNAWAAGHPAAVKVIRTVTAPDGSTAIP